MDKICKKCSTSFEPEFSKQVNCAECRQNQLQRQQKHREKEKVEREAKRTPTHEEWCETFWASADYRRMRQYREETSNKISEELGRRLSTEEQETVGFVLETSFGFENRMTKIVAEYGLMVGNLFPDAIGWTVVPATHEYDLEQSQTFSEIYRPLLLLLDKKFGHIQDRQSRTIKSELAGTYKFIPKVQKDPVHPTPAPVKPVETVPSAEPPQSTQPSPLVDWRHLDSEARSFLRGGR